MKRVLILGATSAIAAHVAEIHARRGDRLYLVGRTESKLADVARRCSTAGTANVANVSTVVADFDALGANGDVIARAIATMGGIDTALIAHGALGDQIASEEDFDHAEAILRTNFTSVVSLLIPLANQMESARAGSIGVITSVAGDRGRPRNYTYGSAKGALNIFLQGLRTRLYPAGVRVTTLKLGPVDTPMTRDHPKNVLFGKPEAVARDIVRAMDRGVAEAYVPSIWGFIMPIVKNTPERLFQRLSFLSGR
jgi:decaprenylphospho-beta-D-erythro-pentofuranosid-2-ulose 2-reductase